MTIKMVCEKLNGCVDFEALVDTGVNKVVSTDIALYNDGVVNINEYESPNHDAWLTVEDMRAIVAEFDKRWGK